MFKAAIFRQARLCPASGPPRAILTSLKPAFRTTRTLQTGRWVRVMPPIPRLLAGRGYSSAAAPNATVEQSSTREPGSTEDLVTRFADLPSLGVHEHLVRSLTDTLGYETMTEVQSKTISPALAGKDLVAQAKTGTGKTLAFLVPIIQKMITDIPDLAHSRRKRARSDDIRGIILSPTRELAEQIGDEARKLCHGTGVIVQTAVGGTRKREMLMRARREGCHLLVATPGRLNDLLNDPYSGIDAPKLSALVLDEADRMLDVGFNQELQEIVRLLPDRSEQPRQTLLFSATLPQDVIALARTYVDERNFSFVQTVKADELPTHERIPQHIVTVKGYENLFPTLLELINQELKAAEENPGSLPFKCLIFLPTTFFVQLASMTFRRLCRENPQLPQIGEIHSKLTQAARTAASDDFKKARSAILFSSDVTARGMDFPNVSHVVQIGVPPNREQYIHRLGRTGRADKPGEGWLIVTADDIHDARHMLPGLPIQRTKGLECADFDMENPGSAPTPHVIEQVSAAMKRVPENLLRNVYLSCFGGARGGLRSLQRLVDNLNNWARLGWGWEEPPAVDQHIAVKLGLLKLNGIRIADARESEHSDRGRGGDGLFDRRGEYRSGGDGFEALSRSSHGGDRYGGGRSGGGRYGGGRSGAYRYGAGRSGGGRYWGDGHEGGGSRSGGSRGGRSSGRSGKVHEQPGF